MNGINFDALSKQFSALRAERIRSALVATNLWGRLDFQGDGLAILSPNSRPKLMNPAFETITGLTKIQQDGGLDPLSLSSEIQNTSPSDNKAGSTLGPNSDRGLDLACILTDDYSDLDISLLQLEADEVLCILWQPKEDALHSRALRGDLNYAEAFRHSFANFLAVISALSDTLPEEGGLSDSTSLGLKRMRLAVDKATTDMTALDRCQSFDRG